MKETVRVGWDVRLTQGLPLWLHRSRPEAQDKARVRAREPARTSGAEIQPTVPRKD